MARALGFLTFLLTFPCLAAQSCGDDVTGDYGQSDGGFAAVVGLACPSPCFGAAARWSEMAIRHGDRRVGNKAACRTLCAATPGCAVWTYDSDAGSCRAMRTIQTSPTLAPDVPNTTSGSVKCGSGVFLPFPDSLQSVALSDANDPCFRPGYLYADCPAPGPQAPLLAVHAPRAIINLGTVHGWWDALNHGGPAEPTLHSTGTEPLPSARSCSEACTGDCAGFSSTHGVCLLRGMTALPAPGGLSYASPSASCRASNSVSVLSSLIGHSLDTHWTPPPAAARSLLFTLLSSLFNQK